MGSTSNRGACTPAAWTAALFSRMMEPTPSATINPSNSAPIENLRFMLLLLDSSGSFALTVAGGQHLVRVHPHDQIHYLRRCDLAKPMRCVRRNNDYVPRSDLAAHPILNHATLRAGPIQHFHHGAVGRGLPRIFNGAAGHESRIAFDDMVDLRDLAM